MKLANLALLFPLFAGCSGGLSAASAPFASPSSSSSSTFEVLSFSIAPGEELPLNRPLDVTFSGDVDLASVTATTLRIRGLRWRKVGSTDDRGGEPAVGSFTLLTPQVVRFTPACPTDSAEGGLRAGWRYTVVLPGAGEPGPAVRSTAGAPLRTTAATGFHTPGPGSPHAYDDPVSGGPDVVFRDQGSIDRQATYLELGLDEGQRVYFERDPSGAVVLPAGFVAPLNYSSRVEERVAWLVQLDQGVDPSPENLAPERVRLEGLASGGVWTTLATHTEIVTNCGEVGALLRVTPIGVLPQGSQVRLVLGAGFRDLAGEARTTAARVAFAPIATAYDPGTTTPGDSGDQRFEGFDFGGVGSLEDTDFLGGNPRAEWSDGTLRANWNFDGVGGPNGDFDWYVPDGYEIVLDTALDAILGGPNGQQTTVQTIVNGVVDLRDFYLPATSRLIVVGPNPMTMLATGRVRIDGEISLRGADNPGVATLNTTNEPEVGAVGRASGGDGGVGSWKTDESTPRGGWGEGPFGARRGGGEGGETSYASTGKNDRRGAGGGGGVHGPDVRYDHDGDGLDPVRCQTLIGLDVERGARGGPGGLGAESGTQRARGGRPGPGPFDSADRRDDFFGILHSIGSDAVVFGELPGVLGGSGGGAGGDAVDSDSFPLVPWDDKGDEKGAGGGGGGGAIRILAMGPIEIHDGGAIVADGGNGGAGENTSFFDRVGGGSGGGSGGMIVLESATSIQVDGVATGAGDFYRDDPSADVHHSRALSALGGQGGAGHDDRGGAGAHGPTAWACDRIPFDHFEGHSDVPPLGSACFQSFPDIDDPQGGPVVGAGGDGGPGLIQLHVPELATDLVFQGAGGDLTKACAPPPVGWDLATATFTGWLEPSIGARSSARSRWIPLGLARHDPSGVDDQVSFFFGGTAPSGEVLASQDMVVLEAPLVGPTTIQSPPATPYIDPLDPYRMVFDASGIAGHDDVYERNPALMQGFTLRLSQVSNPSVRRDFTVALGDYDPALDQLGVTVDASSGALDDFQPGGAVQAELVPRSFQVVTGGAADELGGCAVRITFDATTSDGFGRPDESRSFSEATGAFAGDPSSLNQKNWDFLRFQVEFELLGPYYPDTPPPTLEHLRVPYRF